MAQYSSQNGFPSDWHLVHLGSRAVGGPGLLIFESTAVTPQGRFHSSDSGIYLDEHVPSFARLVDFVHEQGVYACLQLGHCGRKASMYPPWIGDTILPTEDGGWPDDLIAPSAIPFSPAYPVPQAATEKSLVRVANAYRQATRRAVAAGFDCINLHAAHGYLLHEFLSPFSNRRTDEYGGSFENRTRFPLEVVDTVRSQMPNDMPLLVRISATDWLPGEDAWDIDESVLFSQLLKNRGVDLVDVSSGGLAPSQKIPIGAGYQTSFATRIRAEADVCVGTVGLITTASQADHIVRTGQADLVFLAREILRNPYWPMDAARELGQQLSWPLPYMRARSLLSNRQHPEIARQPLLQKRP